MQMKLLGITSVDFDVIGQQLIRSSLSVRYWRKSGNKMVEYISYLLISRKPMIQLGGKYEACPESMFRLAVNGKKNNALNISLFLQVYMLVATFRHNRHPN
jgi:hypothetical protein